MKKEDNKMNTNTMYKTVGAGILAGTAALALTGVATKNSTKRKMKKATRKAVNTFSNVVDNVNHMMK